MLFILKMCFAFLNFLNGPPILSLLQDGYKKADFLKEYGNEERIEKMESQIQGLEYGLDEMGMELRQNEFERMKGEMREMKSQIDELNRTVVNIEPNLKGFAREMMEFVGKMLDEKMANLKEEIETKKAKKKNLKEDGIKNGLISLRAKVNGKLVTAEEKGNKSLVANREAQKEWELFRLFQNDDGTISFRSMANEKFVHVDLDNGEKLIANGNEIGQEEKFTTHLGRTPDSFVFKSKANGKFVSADLNIGGILVADRDEPKSWEQFELIY